VCIAFDPTGRTVATGSMDQTAKLWDCETGLATHTLLGHTGEIVSLHFNQPGSLVITGSFDHTVKVRRRRGSGCESSCPTHDAAPPIAQAWDTRTGACVRTFAGHGSEISATQFNFTGDTVLSGAGITHPPPPRRHCRHGAEGC
jgi:dynein assembly factor with WDR repeat domains 1